MSTGSPPARSVDTRDRRAVTAAIIVLLGGLAVAALTRLALTWDGAWFFVRTMDIGLPTFLYRRVVHWVIQALTIVSRLVADGVVVPGIIFSAAYAAVPVVGMPASWRVVGRDRAALMLWPFLGLLVALPVQAFFISESAFVVHLSWPLVLAAALGRLGRHRILCGALAIAIVASHPMGGPALVAAGAVSALARWRGERGDGRTPAIALVTLGLVASGVFFVVRSPYEAEAASIGYTLERFSGSVTGIALVAPIAAGAIALLVFAPLAGRWRTIAVVAVLAVTGIALVPWALDPTAWATSLRYRAWLVPLEAGLFLLAVADAWGRPRWRDRRPAWLGIALVAALVLGAQGLAWLRLQERLAADLSAATSACVPAQELTWIRGTPLDHWSLTSLGLAVEGRTPEHLIAYDLPCAEAVTPDRVNLKATEFDRDDRPIGGWWRFGPLVERWSSAE